MKRQLREVEDVMARNAHWHPRSERVMDRLRDADAELRRDLVEICEPRGPRWYERINWTFIGAVIGFAALDLALVYVVIRACEAFAKLMEAI